MSWRRTLGGGLSLLFPSLALAGPTGGEVVDGTADISTPDSSTTQIDQATASAIINWQTFSVGADEFVIFNQPSASSVVLNRVIGGSMSEILGNLQANGRVFLVNPMGVLFGESARIDVGGLMATTMDISNSDFMAGNYVFAGDSTAALENRGVLSANNGFVVLSADQVRNTGLIEAIGGNVVLASASGLTLDLDGAGLVGYSIDQAALSELAGIENFGDIVANGGAVVLHADVARQLAGTVVNNQGQISARGIAEGPGGDIFLTASGGDIVHNGVIDASGNRGGTVRLVASDDLTTTTQSVTDASGGRLGGGGFIELSGHRDIRLGNLGTTGRGGTLYIDPVDLTLANGARPASPDANTVYEADIENTLQSGGNVVLDASNSITMQNLSDDTLNGQGTSSSSGFLFEGGDLTLGIGSADSYGNFSRGPGNDSASSKPSGIFFEDLNDSILVDNRLSLIAGSAGGSIQVGNLTSGFNPLGSDSQQNGGRVRIRAAGDVSVGNVTGRSVAFGSSDGSDPVANLYLNGDVRSLDGGISIQADNVLLGDRTGTAGNLTATGDFDAAVRVQAGNRIELGNINTTAKPSEGGGFANVELNTAGRGTSSAAGIIVGNIRTFASGSTGSVSAQVLIHAAAGSIRIDNIGTEALTSASFARANVEINGNGGADASIGDVSTNAEASGFSATADGSVRIVMDGGSLRVGSIRTRADAMTSSSASFGTLAADGSVFLEGSDSATAIGITNGHSGNITTSATQRAGAGAPTRGTQEVTARGFGANASGVGGAITLGNIAAVDDQGKPVNPSEVTLQSYRGSTTAGFGGTITTGDIVTDRLTLNAFNFHARDVTLTHSGINVARDLFFRDLTLENGAGFAFGGAGQNFRFRNVTTDNIFVINNGNGYIGGYTDGATSGGKLIEQFGTISASRITLGDPSGATSAVANGNISVGELRSQNQVQVQTRGAVRTGNVLTGLAQNAFTNAAINLGAGGTLTTGNLANAGSGSYLFAQDITLSAGGGLSAGDIRTNDGAITLSAAAISAGNLSASAYGFGAADASITIDAQGSIQVGSVSADAFSSFSSSNGVANADITIRSAAGNIKVDGGINTFASASGNAFSSSFAYGDGIASAVATLEALKGEVRVENGAVSTFAISTRGQSYDVTSAIDIHAAQIQVEDLQTGDAAQSATGGTVNRGNSLTTVGGSISTGNLHFINSAGNTFPGGQLGSFDIAAGSGEVSVLDADLFELDVTAGNFSARDLVLTGGNWNIASTGSIAFRNLRTDQLATSPSGSGPVIGVFLPDQLAQLSFANIDSAFGGNTVDLDIGTGAITPYSEIINAVEVLTPGSITAQTISLGGSNGGAITVGALNAADSLSIQSQATVDVTDFIFVSNGGASIIAAGDISIADVLAFNNDADFPTTRAHIELISTGGGITTGQLTSSGTDNNADGTALVDASINIDAAQNVTVNGTISSIANARDNGSFSNSADANANLGITAGGNIQVNGAISVRATARADGSSFSSSASPGFAQASANVNLNAGGSLAVGTVDTSASASTLGTTGSSSAAASGEIQLAGATVTAGDLFGSAFASGGNQSSRVSLNASSGDISAADVFGESLTATAAGGAVRFDDVRVDSVGQLLSASSQDISFRDLAVLDDGFGFSGSAAHFRVRNLVADGSISITVHNGKIDGYQGSDSGPEFGRIEAQRSFFPGSGERSVWLEADNGIRLGTINAGDGQVAVTTGGNLTIGLDLAFPSESAAISATDRVNFGPADARVTLSAGGNVEVMGDIRSEAGGSFSFSGAASQSARADVSITASNGSVAVGNISADASGTSSAAVSANVSVTAGAGNLTANDISASEFIGSQQAFSPAITLTAQGGGINVGDVFAAGDFSFSANGPGSAGGIVTGSLIANDHSVRLRSDNGGIITNGSVFAAEVELDGNGLVNVSGDISATQGNVFVNAGAGSVTLARVSAADSGSGEVDASVQILASDSIQVSTISTMARVQDPESTPNSGAAYIDLHANTGNITLLDTVMSNAVDETAGGNADLDASVSMSAGTGISGGAISASAGGQNGNTSSRIDLFARGGSLNLGSAGLQTADVIDIGSSGGSGVFAGDLSADGGIRVTAVSGEIAVGELGDLAGRGNSGFLSLEAAGDLSFANTAGLTAGSIRLVTGGANGLNFGSDFDLEATDGGIVAIASAGLVHLGDINPVDVGSDSSVTISGNDGVTVGDVHVQAFGSGSLDPALADVELSANNGDVIAGNIFSTAFAAGPALASATVEVSSVSGSVSVGQISTLAVGGSADASVTLVAGGGNVSGQSISTNTIGSGTGIGDITVLAGSGDIDLTGDDAGDLIADRDENGSATITINAGLDATAGDINANFLSANASAGNLSLADIQVDNFSITFGGSSGAFGDFDVNTGFSFFNGAGQSISFGNITADGGVQINNLDGNISTGNIDAAGNIDLDTSSGNIATNSLFSTSSVLINSTSGLISAALTDAIEGAGIIDAGNSINIAQGGAGLLSLGALRANSGITLANSAGGIALLNADANADRDSFGTLRIDTAAGDFNGGALAGRDVDLNVDGDVQVSGPITADNSNVDIRAINTLVVGAIDAGTGAVTVRGDGATAGTINLADISAGGNVILGVLQSTDNIGNISIGQVTTTGSLLAQSNSGDVSVGGIAAGVSSVNLVAAGVLSVVGDITGSGAISLEQGGNGLLTLGNLTAASGILISNNGGGIELLDADANTDGNSFGTLRAETVGGNFSAGALAGRNVDLNIDGDVNVAGPVLTDGGNVDINAINTLVVGAIDAGLGAVTVRSDGATAGTIDLANISAGGNVILGDYQTADSTGSISTGQITSTGSLLAQSSSGNISVAGISAGISSVNLDAAGVLSLVGDVTGNGSITLVQGGTGLLVLDRLRADSGISIKNNGGGIDLLSANANTDGDSFGTLRADTLGGGFTSGTLAGRNVDLNIGGDVAVTGTISTNGGNVDINAINTMVTGDISTGSLGGSVTVRSDGATAGNISLQNVDARSSIVLGDVASADNTGVITANNLNAGAAISIAATGGSVSLGAARSGAGTIIDATGTVAASGALISDSGLRLLSTGGDVSLISASADDDSSGFGALEIGAGNNITATDLLRGNQVNLSAGNLIDVGTINAEGNIDLAAIDVFTADLSASALPTAGITATSTGTSAGRILLGNITGGIISIGNVANPGLETGDIEVGNISASAATRIASSQGNVRLLGNANSGGELRITADAGDLLMNGSLTAPTLRLDVANIISDGLVDLNQTSGVLSIQTPAEISAPDVQLFGQDGLDIGSAINAGIGGSVLLEVGSGDISTAAIIANALTASANNLSFANLNLGGLLDLQATDSLSLSGSNIAGSAQLSGGAVSLANASLAATNGGLDLAADTGAADLQNAALTATDSILLSAGTDLLLAGASLAAGSDSTDQIQLGAQNISNIAAAGYTAGGNFAASANNVSLQNTSINVGGNISINAGFSSTSIADLSGTQATAGGRISINAGAIDFGSLTAQAGEVRLSANRITGGSIDAATRINLGTRIFATSFSHTGEFFTDRLGPAAEISVGNLRADFITLGEFLNPSDGADRRSAGNVQFGNVDAFDFRIAAEGLVQANGVQVLAEDINIDANRIDLSASSESPRTELAAYSGEINLQAADDISLARATLDAGRNVNVTAGAQLNLQQAQLLAGSPEASPGDGSVRVRGMTISNSAATYSGSGDFSAQAAFVNLDGSRINFGGNVLIDASNGTASVRNAQVDSGESTTIEGEFGVLVSGSTINVGTDANLIAHNSGTSGGLVGNNLSLSADRAQLLGPSIDLGSASVQAHSGLSIHAQGNGGVFANSALLVANDGAVQISGGSLQLASALLVGYGSSTATGLDGVGLFALDDIGAPNASIFASNLTANAEAGDVDLSGSFIDVFGTVEVEAGNNINLTAASIGSSEAAPSSIFLDADQQISAGNLRAQDSIEAVADLLQLGDLQAGNSLLLGAILQASAGSLSAGNRIDLIGGGSILVDGTVNTGASGEFQVRGLSPEIDPELGIDALDQLTIVGDVNVGSVAIGNDGTRLVGNVSITGNVVAADSISAITSGDLALANLQSTTGPIGLDADATLSFSNIDAGVNNVVLAAGESLLGGNVLGGAISANATGLTSFDGQTVRGSAVSIGGGTLSAANAMLAADSGSVLLNSATSISLAGASVSATDNAEISAGTTADLAGLQLSATDASVAGSTIDLGNANLQLLGNLDVAAINGLQAANLIANAANGARIYGGTFNDISNADLSVNTGLLEVGAGSSLYASGAAFNASTIDVFGGSAPGSSVSIVGATLNANGGSIRVRGLNGGAGDIFASNASFNAGQVALDAAGAIYADLASITAGGASLTATADIVATALNAQIGGGELEILAGNDIDLRGSTLDNNGNIRIDAGNNISLSDAQIDAGQRATARASGVIAAHNLQMRARGGNLALLGQAGVTATNAQLTGATGFFVDIDTDTTSSTENAGIDIQGASVSGDILHINGQTAVDASGASLTGNEISLEAAGTGNVDLTEASLTGTNIQVLAGGNLLAEAASFQADQAVTLNVLNANIDRIVESFTASSGDLTLGGANFSATDARFAGVNVSGTNLGGVQNLDVRADNLLSLGNVDVSGELGLFTSNTGGALTTGGLTAQNMIINSVGSDVTVNGSIAAIGNVNLVGGGVVSAGDISAQSLSTFGSTVDFGGSVMTLGSADIRGGNINLNGIAADASGNFNAIAFENLALNNASIIASGAVLNAGQSARGGSLDATGATISTHTADLALSGQNGVGIDGAQLSANRVLRISAGDADVNADISMVDASLAAPTVTVTASGDVSNESSSVSGGDYSVSAQDIDLTGTLVRVSQTAQFSAGNTLNLSAADIEAGTLLLASVAGMNLSDARLQAAQLIQGNAGTSLLLGNSLADASTVEFNALAGDLNAQGAALSGGNVILGAASDLLAQDSSLIADSSVSLSAAGISRLDGATVQAPQFSTTASSLTLGDVQTGTLIATANGGDIEVIEAVTATQISLTASAGNISTLDLLSQGAINLLAGGNLSTGNLSGTTVNASAGGVLDVTAATIASSSANLNGNSLLASGTTITASSGDAVLAGTTGVNIDNAAIDSATRISVSAGNSQNLANISMIDAFLNAPDVDVTATGSISNLGSTVEGGDYRVTAQDISLVQSSVNVSGNAEFVAANSLNLSNANISAGGLLDLASGGNATLSGGNFAGGNINASVVGALNGGSYQSAGALNLQAASIQTAALSAAGPMNLASQGRISTTAIDNSGTTNLSAGGAISTGNINAAALNIASSNGNVSLGQVQLGSGNAAISAAGDISATSIAGGNLALRGANISGGLLSGTGNISLSAGNIEAAAVTANGNISADAANNFAAGAVDGLGDVAISAGNNIALSFVQATGLMNLEAANQLLIRGEGGSPILNGTQVNLNGGNAVLLQNGGVTADSLNASTTGILALDNVQVNAATANFSAVPVISSLAKENEGLIQFLNASVRTTGNLEVRAANRIEAVGERSNFQLGAVSMQAGDRINLQNSNLAIGTQQASFGGDSTLLSTLSSRGVNTPTGPNPNGAFRAANGISLGEVSLSGNYLFLQSNALSVAGNVTSSGPALVNLRPTGNSNLQIENTAFESTGLGLTSAFLRRFSNPVFALGGSDYNGEILVGSRGAVSLAGTTSSFVFLSNLSVTGADQIQTGGRVLAVSPVIISTATPPPTNDEFKPDAGSNEIESVDEEEEEDGDSEGTVTARGEASETLIEEDNSAALALECS